MAGRIAIAKTGWSEFYEGGPVIGRFGYLSNARRGHECWNFKPGPNGHYYAYLPPIGKGGPQPQTKSGWLIVFVAALDGDGPLTVVGWYENATFANHYIDRPEYDDETDFETDGDGNKFTYCISTERAVLIPPELRMKTVSGEHLRRSPIVYLRGHGKTEPWREELSRTAEDIVAFYSEQSQSGTEIKLPTGFPILSPEYRKEIEDAAVKRVKSHFVKQGFLVKDRQADKCGYDLLAIRTADQSELHVEVKGTSLSEERFYITRNEYGYIGNPKWRLALVTDALTTANLRIFDSDQLKNEFFLEPVTWIVSKKRTGK